jgi:hypothetical protein
MPETRKIDAFRDAGPAVAIEASINVVVRN